MSQVHVNVLEMFSVLTSSFYQVPCESSADTAMMHVPFANQYFFSPS